VAARIPSPPPNELALSLSAFMQEPTHTVCKDGTTARQPMVDDRSTATDEKAARGSYWEG
jgi:hypothetical protein